ncbi:MAG: protein kinase [Oscillospiraceae bacterium]|nr:protein kinase [Oscillospiraceae bacterium]
MSELKLVSPLLDGFAMGEPISSHDGSRCCPAMKENSDDKYIVKIISVPASQKQLDALLLTGAYKDTAAAAQYFKELAEDTVKEARLLQQLAKLEGFLSYEDWQIVPMDGEDTGYDVYLLGSYKHSLEKFLRRNTMTHLGAVNLGIDLCSALSLCRRAGFIYTDLKPGNIFITGQKEYRIGDLGFAKLGAMKYTSINASYISRFTPPELHDPLATLNPTVDTYAVGMILYMIYNNGHIPFKDKAPMMILPAPLNADYEMAEIILKACDPNPRKRYQTPVEMGKALVSYMQRNSINDVPIVPPSADPILAQPAALADVAPERPAEISAPPAAQEPEELHFLNDLVSDDTAPGADKEDDLAAVQTTDEVDEILSQADDLISHEPDITPEELSGETAAEEDIADADEYIETEAAGLFTEEEFDGEPEDVPVPAPGDEPAPVPEEASDGETEPCGEVFEEDIPADEAGMEIDDEDFNFDFGTAAKSENNGGDDLEFGVPEAPSVAGLFGDEDDFLEEAKPRRKKRGWIGILILLLILALLGGGGYYYYDNYYLLTIDNMVIDGFENSLTVQLSTNVDEALLTVVCTDTYGNRQEEPVMDGKAFFTDLNADTMYKITVVTEGFHKVGGAVSGSYTTAEETRIVDFTAKAGLQDGSVILNFTVDGPESQSWTVEYTDDGEQVQSTSFNGHMVTINDLNVGKLYTFTLVPNTDDELYLNGNTTLEFMASKIVLAEKLTIVSCVDGVLTAEWNLPEGLHAESWAVRCYSEDGYDETVTVTDTTVQFSNISSGSAYTLEVTAAGMSQSVRAYVTANPATVTDVQTGYDAKHGMTLSWKSTSEPEGGWLVMYSIDGSETTMMAECTGTTAVVKDVIPNAAYSFQIMAADGSTVFGGTAEHAGIGQKAFDRYGLSASKIQSSLCRSPGKEGWTYKDVKNTDYTTSYTKGEAASLVLYTNALFYLERDDTNVMFVIRDEAGKVIPSLIRTQSAIWRDLWLGTGKYCYLDIPVMPNEFGDYTIEVYFNGALALTKNFSIISDIG